LAKVILPEPPGAGEEREEETIARLLEELLPEAEAVATEAEGGEDWIVAWILVKASEMAERASYLSSLLANCLRSSLRSISKESMRESSEEIFLWRRSTSN
jgi:hypothetical protein